MPVDVDRFEQGPPGRDSTTSERLLRFLAANDAQAFTRRELAEAIDRDPETVGTNLTRLKDRGLVRHRTPYWAFTDDRAHARAALEERYGEAVAAEILDHSEAAGLASNRGAHRAAAEAYRDRVRDRLPDAVEAVHLFGSVARGTETATSDVDVLVVVADEVDFAAVDDVLLELAYDVQLEHDVPVEVHAVRAGEFDDRRERGDPFVRSVLAAAEAGGEDDRETVPRSAIERECSKAERALEDARKAEAAGISTATIVTRLDSACFHAVQAALYALGLNPQSHGQIQTWLGRELVTPGVVARERGRFLNDVETYRRRVEYGSGGVEREVGELIQRTAGFLDAMRAVVEGRRDD